MKTVREIWVGTAAVFVALLAVALPARAKDRIIFNRVGPSTAELFIAKADGTGERKLLTTSELDYSPSFSRDGKWIVFTSERAGPSNIYRTHPDGSGLERLTDDSAFDDQAALSPNDKRLAFVSTRAKGTADIWILDLRRHRSRNLTQGAGGNFRPSWSPDGKWLAFSSDRNTPVRPTAGRFEQLQEASIYVMRPDGSGLRRLTPAGRFSGSPQWSTDGKQVVFYDMDVAQTQTARAGMPGGAVSQIVAVDVLSGARTALTSGPGLKVQPQFVRGAVAYLVKEGEHAGLASTSSDLGTAGNMRNPAWSPDGKQVVYQRLNLANRPQNSPLFSKNADDFELAYSDIFPAFSRAGKLAISNFDINQFLHASISVMDADGEHAKRIVEDDQGGAAVYASWSPDSEWIAYGYGDLFVANGRPSRIMMVRADGSERRELTKKGPNDSAFPSFSSDGKRIVYRVSGPGERGLRILNVEDGSINPLTTEHDNFPQWSPTGDRIVFTRAIDGAYDIFSIRADGTDLTRLTSAPGNDAHAVWSPDGNHLVFSSSRLGFKDEAPLYDSSPQPYAKLFIMNADGSEQRPLTDNKWEEGTPAWQPTLPKE